MCSGNWIYSIVNCLILMIYINYSTNPTDPGEDFI